MLNKYYNKCQKHVEKCLESFEDFRNISYFIHRTLTFYLGFFLLRELVCQFLPFMFENKFSAVN